MGLNILMRLIAVFVVTTVIYFSVSNKIVLFTWHPIFMSIGFIVLMTEAVVAFASDSFVTRNLRYSEKLAWHWILQVAAASAVLLGFLSIYIHKNNNNYEHFKSTHASMGLNTMIMMAGVSTGGLFAKYSQKFRTVIRPAYIKIVHSAFGAITYVFALATLCYGLNTGWFKAQSSGLWQIVLILATALLAFLAALNPVRFLLRKLSD